MFVKYKFENTKVFVYKEQARITVSQVLFSTQALKIVPSSTASIVKNCTFVLSSSAFNKLDLQFLSCWLLFSHMSFTSCSLLPPYMFHPGMGNCSSLLKLHTVEKLSMRYDVPSIVHLK